MTRKIKRSPWYVKLNMATDKESGDKFVKGVYSYQHTKKEYVNSTEEFNLDELISGDVLELKLTDRVRNTRNDSYVKLETVTSISIPVKVIDPTTGITSKVKRGNSTYVAATYDFKPSGLFLEVRGSELPPFFRYYDCKSKTLKIPLKEFTINNRTESPSIVLNNGKV